METIHLKTVDPISQELLRPASQRGIRINWERYEGSSRRMVFCAWA